MKIETKRATEFNRMKSWGIRSSDSHGMARRLLAAKKRANKANRKKAKNDLTQYMVAV